MHEEKWDRANPGADFFEQLALEGAPPKVVWLRTGDLRRVELQALFVRRGPHIVALPITADLGEVYPDRLESISFGS